MGKAICTCGNKKGWYLETAERSKTTGREILYGIVRCSKCRSCWRTRAKYIRKLPGADRYSDEFQIEDRMEKQMLQNDIDHLKLQLQMVRKKICEKEGKLRNLEKRNV